MDTKAAFELSGLDAIGQARLVASGDVTATELLDAALTRLDSARGLNAVIHDLFDRGRRQAAELDASGRLRGGASGPLAGVPYLLKDLGASVGGAPESMGSRALRSRIAPQNAWIVDRYLSAGLVVFGKTNTPEWGNHCTTEPSLFGPTVNPWSPDVTPGGSSGGSAAAVAAGVVPAASGGDGTGSIRVPASCCGLVGLKPRRARTSFAPAGHLLEGLAVEHALTRTVRDSAALLDAVTGPDPGDPYSAAPPPMPFLQAIAQQPAPQRIVISTGSPFPGPATDPEIVAAVEAAGRLLADLGHRVEPGAPTVDPDAVADAIAVLHNVSNAQLHALATDHLGRPPAEDEFEASTWVMVREGFTTTGVQYAGAIETVHAETRRFVASMAAHDVLLAPTLLTPPPPYATLDQPRGTTRAFFDVEFATTGWTALANVTGWAAISLPLGMTSAGPPIGVQLMAPEETVLLQLAAQLEEAAPWAGRRPAGWVAAAAR
ncbi:amidase [Mycolicibacterium litorale]|uniref:amidase n=1 Tax=Mycolicibacterium litorale TaxID=758802 RepID=A0AAD1II42_9MYCO|nr:amidase [Mycolicibacterium litorale]MCV7414869.1 amidase [Mycolicibacterium litorale]TDY08116.1 amidase [Mycolicibacterium litorale]BBY16037.1 6-aminohexanoate-cyclic-dimer hydrolase [Mycolicibacterium litorale]